jgi:hypothetical protein
MESRAMTVRAGWDNVEKTLVVYDFDSVWNWDDFYRAKAECEALVDSVEHAVDVIFSGPPEMRLPESFIDNAVAVARSRHPRTRSVVIVINNAILRAMFNTLAKLFPREFAEIIYAASLDEARALVLEGSKRALL